MLTRLAPSRNERGFSLAEMLIAMIVFALLASIAVPIFLNQRKKAANEAIKTDLINASLVMEEKRAANNGRYPDKLPREVSYAKDATVAYSFPAGRASYCLQMSLNDKKMQISSASKEPVDVTGENDCSYGISLAAPRLTGQLTNDNIPQLFWDAVDGAASYNIYANDALKTTVGGGKTTYAVNLARQEGGTSVRYRVAAVSETDIEGERSRAVQLNAPLQPPATAPTLSILSAVEGTNGEVVATLKWTPVPSASKYEIYDDANNEMLSMVTNTTFEVTVPMGQDRTYYVVAANDAGAGPASNKVVVEGPVLPAPVLDGDISDALVTTLTWDTISGATSYRVFRDNAPFGNVAFDGEGKAIIAANASTPGSLYAYEVAAVDNRGREGKRSNLVNIGVQISNPVLTASDGAVNANGQKAVKFTWQKIAGATDYLIYDASNSALLKTVPGSSLTTTIDALVDPSKTRTFYLVARGATGDSERSKTVSIKGITPTFSGLTYTQNVTNGEPMAGATFTWTNQPYATGYQVTITGGTPVTYNIAKGATSWSTSDTYLGTGTSNVTRTFTMKALYQGGAESPQQVQEVFLPARPTNLSNATKISVGHLRTDWRWTWTRPAGTTQSKVVYKGRTSTAVTSTPTVATYTQSIAHADSGTIEVRAMSPDQKMLSGSVTGAVSSPHPAPWSNNGNRQYNFMGTGPGIMARLTYGSPANELYYYPAASNGMMGTRAAIGGKGWAAMKYIVPVYDWQGKGSSGIFAVDRASGQAYYYASMGPTTGSGATMTRTAIGAGRNWAAFKQITYYHEWDGPGNNAIIGTDSSNNLWRFTTNSDGTINNDGKIVGTAGWSEVAGSSDWDGDGRDEIMMRTTSGEVRMYQRGADTMVSGGMLSVGSSGWLNFSFQPFESFGGLRGVQASNQDDGVHYWYPYRAGAGSLIIATRVQNGVSWGPYWEVSAGRAVNCNTTSYGTGVCN